MSDATRNRIKLTLAAGAALALAACSMKQEHRSTFEVAPTTGLLALDVENFRGDIDVRVDRRTQRATVVGVAHAGRSLGDQQGMALAGTTYDAQLIENGAQGVLRVRTTTNRENTGDHWMNLSITLPRCDGVRIDNRGGLILVVGTGGATEITNREGVIEFRTAQPITDPVTLTTTDGNVFYQVPVGSTGRFDLETLDGTVWYRDRVSQSDDVYSAPRVHQATLGEGENPVIARTNRGNINIFVDEDPEGTTRLIKWTFTDPRDRMFLQGSRRHTRNLPEDHPEVQTKLRPRTGLGNY